MNKVICGGFNVGRGLRANGKVLELLGKIPQITDEDEGKVLGVKDGELAWIEAKTFLTFTAIEADSTVAFTKHIDDDTSTIPIDVNLKYSVDNGTTWNTLAYDTPITLANVGDKVMIKGNNPKGMNYDNVTEDTDPSSNWNQFELTGKISASGDVLSLISEDMSVKDLSGTNYCFLALFDSQEALVKAPNVGATKLGEYCYNFMFYNTSITTAPELPAITLANGCYKAMFQDCVFLTIAPKLPAISLAESCYMYMFKDCTSLTTAPELPATTLADNCYNGMFIDCEFLTTAPELPAISLVNGCYYYMFQGCTSLITAPELPATTLAERCYQYMFYNCTMLSEIRVGFTVWNPTALSTYDWLHNVFSTGTFYCPSALPQEFSDSKIPTGWTVVNI